MSIKILEYVGGEGIIHTDPAKHPRRLDTPLPGDIIDFGKDKKLWPYHDRFGTVEAVPGVNGHGPISLQPGQIYICCEPGSVYLGLRINKPIKEILWSDYPVSVSISGGPFQRIEVARLVWTGFGQLACWNWGNNSPDAHQGVHYHITRPVFSFNHETPFPQR